MGFVKDCKIIGTLIVIVDLLNRELVEINVDTAQAPYQLVPVWCRMLYYALTGTLLCDAGCCALR